MRTWIMLIVVLAAVAGRAEDLDSEELARRTSIQCGNLIYAGTKSSVCFADRFLTRVATETTLDVAKKFTAVKLGSEDLFRFPFVVFSGEGDFALTAQERENLRKYLRMGGFIVASPGCSNRAWDTAFRRELAACFPDTPLAELPMSHPVFKVVYEIESLSLSHGGSTSLEGMTMHGRLVLIYSRDGLNDVAHAKGCCCCGGNEVVECEKMNVNIFTYALVY